MRSFISNLSVAAAVSVMFISNAFSANSVIELQSIDQSVYNGVTATVDPLSTEISIQQDSVYSFRNFFVFDFNGLNMSTLVSAEFYANNSWNSSTENNIEFALFDVSTNVAELRKGGLAIYNDLGSGVEYASVQITNPGRYDNFTMTFNQSGVDAAKATDGLFAIGGAFTSQTAGLTWLLADNGNLNAPLSYGLRLTFSDSVSAVPEVDNLFMLLAGMGVLSLFTSRRNGK